MSSFDLWGFQRDSGTLSLPTSKNIKKRLFFVLDVVSGPPAWWILCAACETEKRGFFVLKILVFLYFIKKNALRGNLDLLSAATFRGMVWGVVVYYRSGTGNTS